MKALMTRRQFLRTTGIGISALIVGCGPEGSPELLDCEDIGLNAEERGTLPGPNSTPVSPAAEKKGTWAWVRISEKNEVFIAINKAEMGQGITTGLAMIVAEELGADWSQVYVVPEPQTGTYHLSGTGMAGTSESTSVRNQYQPLREIGATARALLITAAAQRWNVDPESLEAEGSQITGGPDGSTLDFGALVEEAKALEVPEEITLKDASSFRLIGSSPAPKGLDDVVQGTRIYGIDAAVEGMAYAAIRHAPVLGGEISNFEELSLEGTGAEALVMVPGGIAVVANSYWKANTVVQGLDAIFSEPEEGANFSTEAYRETLKEAITGKGVFEALSEGDAEKALDDASTTVEAEYEVPFLAHACMEPMTATADVRADSCEVWAPIQSVAQLTNTLASELGMKAENITVHRTYLGTGFGRKTETDFGLQAALISKAVEKPVKLIWSREEDIQNDFYRPAFMCRMNGGLDEDGKLSAWLAVSAGESILGERGFPLPLDPVSLDGLIKLDGFAFESLEYAIPHQLVSHAQVPSPMRCGFWRSVGNSQNTFFVESFIDELAHAAKTDPLDFRLNLLDGSSRGKAVVERLKEEASWGTPITEGASQGMGFCNSYESFFAVAVEVTVEDGKIRVHRATGVVDCGQTIHPDLVRGQLEGGIIFGMGAGMLNAITVIEGQVQESNFNDFPMPRMADAPEIHIAYIQSEEAPGGIGELAVGPTAPAIANAIFAATGERLRSLPLAL